MTDTPQEELDGVPAPAEAELDRFLEEVFKPGTPREERAGGELPRAVGGHAILAQVGHGGMGIVLRGHDADLGRDVALKILKPRYASDPGIVRRFIEEARIGAQLQHPGIVPVYRIGKDEQGEPFFSMKLVDGRSLAALLADRPGLEDERARLLDVFLKTAQAVAFAHSRGIVHRDLKPANVMVGSFGEVHVVDWGLAKQLSIPEAPAAGEHPVDSGSDSAFHSLRLGTPPATSEAGEVIGTLAYMAPEQARGEREGVDARADVFSLGGILCEILTGSPPYTGSARGDVRRHAAAAELSPALGRLESSTIEAELASIARRCLLADPQARFQDAGELARALEEWYAAVEARARTAELAAVEARTRGEEAERQAALERRARRTTMALTAVILLAVLGGSAIYAVISSERRERERSTETVIAAALQDAAVLRAQAQAGAPEALELWRRAEASIARAAAAAQAGDAPQERRELILARQSELQVERGRALELAARAAAEKRVVQDLDRARENYSVHFRSRRLREDTQAALAAYEVDVEALSIEEAASRIAASPVSRSIVDALDYCARQGLGGPERIHPPFQRLCDIAQAADKDPACAELRRAILERDPVVLRRVAESAEFAQLSTVSLADLGVALGMAGDADASRACLLRAQALHPDDFWICHALVDPALGPDAIGYGRACVAIRPQSAAAWNALGVALGENNRAQEALDAFLRVVALDPSGVRGHQNLALALAQLGDHKAALESARRAVELEPSDAGSLHQLLSESLQVGDPELGSKTYAELVARFDSVAGLHSGLGYWLNRRGELERAVEEYQRSLALDPADPGARLCDLARPLRNLGRFREGYESLRRGIEAGSARPDWKGPPAELLTEYQELAALEDRLDLLLAGKSAPLSGEERWNLARMCEVKGLHAAEARFYAEGLGMAPTLAGAELSSARLHALRAALRAAAGEGRDAAGLAAADAGQLREQALQWLRAEVDERSKALERGDANLGEGQESLEEWLHRPEVLRLCAEDALAAWAPDARAALRELLAEVDRLRASAK